MATRNSVAPALEGHGIPGLEVHPRPAPGVTAYPVYLDGHRIGRVMNGSGGWTAYAERLGALRERVGFSRNGHTALAMLVEAETARRTEAAS